MTFLLIVELLDTIFYIWSWL